LRWLTVDEGSAAKRAKGEVISGDGASFKGLLVLVESVESVLDDKSAVYRFRGGTGDDDPGEGERDTGSWRGAASAAEDRGVGLLMARGVMSAGKGSMEPMPGEGVLRNRWCDDVEDDEDRQGAAISGSR
jgi:hypothetical protein